MTDAGATSPRGNDTLLDESRLVDLLDALPLMVAYWDLEMRNLFVNARYSEVFGLPRASVLGRSPLEVLGHDLFEQDRTYIEAALGGETQRFERRLVDLQGHEKVKQVTLVPDVHDGRVRGMFVAAQDVTPRVASERALEESVRQLALLEERQRIAADLHDVVIQRLFAVGLDLQRGLAGKADLRERAQSATEGIDEAITELRLSIHSLKALMEPTSAPTSVERIVRSAHRLLGFPPVVTFSGSLDHVPTRIVAEALAVLNEALANVARHAGATRVHLTVDAGRDELAIRVADDGCGVDPAGPARRSGLANMHHRAELLGGVFVCRPNEPRGTVVDWVVPLPGESGEAALPRTGAVDGAVPPST